MYEKNDPLTEIQFDTGTVEGALELTTALSSLTSSVSAVVLEIERLNVLLEQQAQGLWLDVMNAISAVCTVIQTAIALTEAHVAAKLASKAEDIAIIALYLVDYAKAFGAMVAQIAASTAAWISNAAAKVASTAAEWAQIAATTAWNALCAVATTVTTAFGAAMAFLKSPIGIVVVAITALIAIVVLLVKNWDTVSAKVKEVWGAVQAKFAEFDAFLQNVFAHNFTEQFGAFGHILNAFFANVKNIWEAVKTVFSGIINFISGIFSGDWKKAWSGIVDVFSGIWKGIVAVIKVPINGIIGIINALISHVVSGINAVIGVLNNLKFTVPDWIPGLGGKSVNLNLSYVTAPQIPLLAKGAVLPANQPFLAVVGDQRHGTNVEAPLSTIQEAVALVMQDQTAAILSGFEASVGVQREILEAVLGIQIGDDLIGSAVTRYTQRQAVIRGGAT